MLRGRWWPRSVRVAVFAKSGAYVVTGGDDHAVKVWDVRSLRAPTAIARQRNNINRCASQSRHTHTHTHAHTGTHTHTQRHTYIHMYVYTGTHRHSGTHTYV
jgi:WD40 repeat protein